MNDTPRTEAEMNRIEEDEKQFPDRYDCYCELLNFCRQLETELAAATVERDALREAVQKRDDAIVQILESAAAIANGDCPPWDSGDEPDECPEHECIKCWHNWIKESLNAPAEARRSRSLQPDVGPSESRDK
jgi:hypothetical protein